MNQSVLVLLHTAEVHVATFGALLAEWAPDVPVRHVVEAGLLEQARRTGPTPALAEQVAERLRTALADDGAVALCTCSTIGALAEAADVGGAAVLRVDRAMAERAVELGPRVVVLAALASTLAPTRALIEAAAQAAGCSVEVSERLCAAAWPLFERGASEEYLATVAACARRAAAEADVVVLAQASMAGAATLLADLAIPVLASPTLGVQAAVTAYRARLAGA